MKILHTSDWHLGRNLYGRKRDAEFSAFLDWLLTTITQEAVDLLLVAGDIFDNTTPSNRVQTLYYQFLCQVATSCCHHVVVIGGNHDSPSFLNAPQALLKTLNIHVIGVAAAERAAEVLQLNAEDGTPALFVCAVPYLRDRDLRLSVAGESMAEKEQKLLTGIQDHYAAVATIAEEKRQALGPSAAKIPIIAMGHLFTTGGQTLDGDGVRNLYVGTLLQVAAGIFPTCFDYVALGHLHVPQKVKGLEQIRYSGSPLPMGFSEAQQEKSVCLVTFQDRIPQVQLMPVPVFQPLIRLRGDWDSLATALQALVEAKTKAWLEIIYSGESVLGDLQERLAAAVQGSDLEILRIQNKRLMAQVLQQAEVAETLDELSVEEVFERCLTFHSMPTEQQARLRQAHQEILSSLADADIQAE